MFEKLFIITAILTFLSMIVEGQEAKLNETAPDFVLKDVDGKEFKLSDLKGKAVVLEWINFDCPFVKKHYESNNMQSLQAKYTEKGIVWLAICSSAPGKQGHFSAEEIKKRTDNHKAKFTAYLIDEDGKVGKLYGAKTTPHMFIIDNNGTLVYAGAIDDKPTRDPKDIPNSLNYVSKALDELLDGKKVSTQSSQPYGCSVKY
jgi:peroxiredoxin